MQLHKQHTTKQTYPYLVLRCAWSPKRYVWPSAVERPRPTQAVDKPHHAFLAEMACTLTSMPATHGVTATRSAGSQLPPYCFSSGNAMTSLMLAEFVSSMTSLSMPMPRPPQGGMPYSSAVRKS